jgi:lipopolysaccharide exporter
MSFGRNVLKLVTSRVGAQAVGLVLAPIVTRMFTPEDFGILQVFTSIMSVLGVVVCLRYEQSIPLGRSDDEAVASLTLSAMTSLIFSCMLFLTVVFIKSQVAVWFKSYHLETFVWLLPIAIGIGGLQDTLRYWAAYKMQFGLMAWGSFVRALIMALTPIGWYVIWGRSPEGLLASIFTGVIGAMAVLLFSLPSFRILILGIKEGGIIRVIDVAKYHKKFPIYSTWSSVINALSNQMLPFFLALYFPVKFVGYYSLAQRLISRPISLLGNSISWVFIPNASQEYQKTGDISDIVCSTVKRLSQVGIFPMAVIGLSSSKFFAFIFGEEWTEAGIYAQILSLAFLCEFIVFPIANVFLVKSQQDLALIYSTVLALSRLLVLLLTIQINLPRIILGAYTVTSVTVYVLVFGWLLWLSNVSPLLGLKIVLQYLLISAVLLLPTAFIVFTQGDILSFLFSLFLATIAYILFLYKVDKSLRLGVKVILNRITVKTK